MWRKLFVLGKPNFYEFHNAYINVKFQGPSCLIESSSKKIEEFLNFLYDMEPKLLEKFIERVEINEEKPTMWSYMYVHSKLEKCIKRSGWERIIDMISASDIITAKLEYYLECLKNLTKELK
jgi:hypothetical protein